MSYGYKKETSASFCDVVDIVKKELSKEGFGILSEIDVKKTLKEKIDVEYDDYIILGACNPKFAYEILEKEKDIGLFLPCNVILYREKETVFISTILPTSLIRMSENKDLYEVAKTIEEKLKKVIDNVVKK